MNSQNATPYILSGMLGVAVFLLVSQFLQMLFRAREGRGTFGALGEQSSRYKYLPGNLLPEDMDRIKIIILTVFGAIGAVIVTSRFDPNDKYVFITFILGVVFALASIYMGFMVPDLILDFLYHRQLEMMNRQLVDALNVLCLSLRSGRTLETAFPVVAAQTPSPLREQFETLVQEVKVAGLSLPRALDRLSQRVPLKDMQIFVAVSKMAMQLGGPATQIFERNAQLIRERYRLRQKMSAMTAEGRFTAIGVALAPAVVLIVNFFIDPQTVGGFFRDSIGMFVVVLMFISDYVGYRLLVKLTQLSV